MYEIDLKQCLFPQEGHGLAGDGSEHRGAKDGKPEQLPQLAVGGCKGHSQKGFLPEITLSMVFKAEET